MVSEHYLQHVVKTSKPFNKDVRTLIPKLVATGDEKVERTVDVEIQMPITTVFK